MPRKAVDAATGRPGDSMADPATRAAGPGIPAAARASPGIPTPGAATPAAAAGAPAANTDQAPTLDSASLTNGALARIFHEIGDMLEVKGELVFKTVAYHRAADALAHSPIDVPDAYRRGPRPRIPGVGQAIGDKIAELVATGRLRFYDKLRAEIPPTLVDMLEVPGLGPRTVKLLHEQLGIGTLAELREAASVGRLRTVKGLSERSEQAILEGIEGLAGRSDRMLLGEAERIIDQLSTELAGTPGLISIEPAGSFRRRRETIGDLDLLAETADPDTLVERFANLQSVERIVNRGSYKAAIRLLRGPQVDLMVMPPGQAGTYRIHFTGSKEHNVRLRERARDRGWSLSEKGYLRLAEDGEPETGPEGELRTFAGEAEAYGFLGLPFIEPELREDHGEIEAALAGRLPNLVSLADLRGDCHSHSDWSDGVHPIEAMAESARNRGYAYQVLTDHSQSLAIAKGLAPDRVARQRTIVADLNARFEREETERAEKGEGFRLLHGCELEIRADGRLDFDDPLLASFDVVVASLHVARAQSRSSLTARVLGAIHSPHVDIIAHPAGRMLQTRDDLDLDWDAVFEAAAATGTALEMNGSDHRLDLSAERARRAVEMGCLLAIDSDAHRTEELDFVRWGVAQARRAWVEPAAVINARSRADLLAWVAGKPSRVRG